MKRLSIFILSFACAVGCGRQAQTISSSPTLAAPPTTGAATGVTPDSVATATPKGSDKPAVSPNGATEGTATLPLDPGKVGADIKKGNEAAAKALEIPASGSEDWTPSSMSATILGQEVEKNIAAQKNLLADVNVVVQDPDGNKATGGAQIKIKDAGTFNVPFVAVKNGITSNRIVSNGKEKMEQLSDSWQPKVPADKPLKDSVRDPKQVAMGFDKEFMRLAFAPVTDHQSVWDSAIGQWVKGVGSYNVSVEQRWLYFNAIPTAEGVKEGLKPKPSRILQYRIHAVRSGQAALMQGRSEVEIVIDDIHKLPVTVRSTFSTPDGKKTWKLEWGAQYHWLQQFQASDFVAPWDMKPRKSGSMPTAVAG